MNNKNFLNWIANRLVNVYRESENTDFIIKLRELAEYHDKENYVIMPKIIYESIKRKSEQFDLEHPNIFKDELK
jgi:hypothetical protein